jgi:hypothetical protein
VAFNHHRRRPDLVLLYAPPWSGATRFSKHHLASYLAGRGYRVLYVEAPLTPLGLARDRRFASELLRSLLPPRRTREHLWVGRPLCPVPYHAVSKLTASRAANRVGQAWLAPLLRGYLRLGAQVCGPPAHDRRFRCADLFTVLDVERVDRRLLRHLLGDAG